MKCVETSEFESPNMVVMAAIPYHYISTRFQSPIACPAHKYLSLTALPVFSLSSSFVLPTSFFSFFFSVFIRSRVDSRPSQFLLFGVSVSSTQLFPDPRSPSDKQPPILLPPRSPPTCRKSPLSLPQSSRRRVLLPYPYHPLSPRPV